MDGADCNRQFVKMHFRGKDPIADKFVTTNVYTGTPMVFIMDPKVILINSLQGNLFAHIQFSHHSHVDHHNLLLNFEKKGPTYIHFISTLIHNLSSLCL